MSTSNSDETIWVITDDFSTSVDTQRSYRETAHNKGVKLTVGELEQKTSHFLNSVGRIFRQAEQQENQFAKIQLDEI